MNSKMTLREFMAIALPEVVPNLSEEEQTGIMQRFQNGEIGRPEIDELADLHALDEFNITRSYDILEVQKICTAYEKCLDLYSMSGDEGNLIWQKISDWQDDQSNRHHNLRRNPLALMSDKNKKAVFRNVGKPCDMVQVLQMFHEAYESEDQCNEDANNKQELFPILRKRFEYWFKFKVDGRILTYYHNFSNSLREMMLTDFWFNLRPHWTGIYMKRRAKIEEIENRDKAIMDKIERGWYFAFEERKTFDRIYNENRMLFFQQNAPITTYDGEDCVYQAIMKACKELDGKVSFSIGEIMDKCIEKAVARHRIIWPIACKNDALLTKHYFEMFECYARTFREIGNEYRKVVELTKLMQTNQVLLKKTLNQTGLKALERMEKAKGKYKELEYRMIHLLPAERYREEEHERAMALDNRLLELAKGFDAELTQKQVERLHEHIKELECEFIRDKPIEGIDKPSGYDMTECPICGTQFDCSQDDYFHHAECPICKETMFVLPGMSLWNKLLEAGEEEKKSPAEEPEEPKMEPIPIKKMTVNFCGKEVLWEDVAISGVFRS